METEAGGQKEKLIGGKANPGNEIEGEDDKIPGAYNCNICGRSFPFLSSLSQHMRRHTGVRPYKCPYCDHRASQKGNLKVHIRSHKLGTLSSHHSNEDEEGGAEEEEMKVSEGLNGSTSPTKSSSACNKVISGDAGEESRRKMSARSMKREKSVTNQRPFCCRLCGYEAQREDQLLSHIEKVHITADAAEEPVPVKEEDVTEPDVAQSQSDGTFPCETCGQVFTQAWFLKSHMKKHAGILDHCCRICGRRFREAWFLKSHMKTHNTKSRSRSKADSAEHPATINDVAQDPDAVTASVTSVYHTCSKCGNLFHNKESLRAHEKVHSQSFGRKSPIRRSPSDDEGSPAAKRRLLEYLNLQCVEVKAVKEEEDSENMIMGQRIPELDPVCSYQAWQLATKGRVVEPVEPNYKASYGGGSMEEDALSEAAVVFEKESSRYVLQGQEKRSSGRRSSSGVGSHTSSGDRTPESLSDSEYRPSCRQDRRRSSQPQASSKGNECFECGKTFRSRHQMIVHQRVHRKDGGRASVGDKERTTRNEQWGHASDVESGSPSRPSTPGYGDSPPASTLGDQASEMGTSNSGELADVKPFVCSMCDFVTSESQAFSTHVRVQHPAVPNDKHELVPSPTSSLDRGSSSSYPKLKADFVQGLKTAPHDPTLTPVDLCVRAEGIRGTASLTLDRKSLPSHKCSFCSHSTSYPEVLWMHQTVAHRINSSSSSLAPKWALKTNSKGSRDASWTLLLHILQEARSQLERQRLLCSTFRPEGTSRAAHWTVSVLALLMQILSGLPRSSAPNPGCASRASDRYFMPQEGLGFMLSSKHSRAQGSPHQQLPSSLSQSRPNISRPSTIIQSSVTAPNSAGFQTHADSVQNSSSPSSTSSSSSSSIPEGRRDVKQDLIAETPELPTDVLRFLKNYSPQELAALYHRWGAANVLLDPTGTIRSLMRQGPYFCHECGKSFSQPSHLRTHMRSHTVGFDFNGLHRGTDAHTNASEAPRQGKGHSAASSAHTEPLRKGT
uniref:Zinc finger protein 516 n=1 Tax=Nothobranchius pienaari TaxID=704102 RepID=A0A1A8LC56_9TELE